MRRYWFILTAWFIAGCTSVSQPEDAAQARAAQLQARTASILANAGEPYPVHAAEIDLLLADVEKEQIFARDTLHNRPAAEQWTLMLDAQGYLMAGVFERWKQRGYLRPAAAEEMSKAVAEGFEQIKSTLGKQVR